MPRMHSSAILENGNVKSYKAFQLHKSFSYKSYVWGWSALFSLGIALGASFLVNMILVAVFYTKLNGVALTVADRSFINMMSLRSAVVGMGFSLAWALRDRVEQFDRNQEKQGADFEFNGPPGPIETKRQGREVALVDGKHVMSKIRPPKTLAYAGTQFTFTGVNLDALLRWTKGDNYSMRRNSGGGKLGFDALPDPIISTNYTDALHVLEQNDYVTKSGVGYTWTDQGMEWLKSE